ATIKFGVTTDTLDTTGTVVDTCSVLPDKLTVENVLGNFIGEIDQIPPNYSAKCVNGKRGYELSRKGIEFELPPKKVVIYDIKLLEQVDTEQYKLEIVCGGGTYIRSLCRDIGTACNTLAVMSGLERTASGKFDLSTAVSVEDFKASETPEQYIIPADFAVDFPKLILTPERAQKILDGVFENHGYADGVYRVYNQQDFWGIGQAKDGVLKITSYVR
ncbi:MAG: tRNA pseudouridine(55) synthase TruB, partial [Clostridia bacterium]|nr:tRNA pseudouridine(55) synthase TruB [Clostridia bacterium]